MSVHSFPKKHRVMLLDTTLRDGSYAINFKFTATDTKRIAGLLEKAGFEFIEIGHGVGLGASEKGLGVAAETDEDYLIAVATTLQKAKYGMFCIPGIANLEHVDLAGKYGMKFIRIGTNVTEVVSTKPFIERAKKYGMFVSSNLMKSYAMAPKEFAKKAKEVHDYGADLLYIVDSAGAMLPNELEKYFKAIRAVTDIPIGFHGHNNLGLATANSLKAVELGAMIVDGSLQGLGRSSGNAATEVLVCLLKRAGYTLGIDHFATMDIGEDHVKPLITSTGIHSLDVIAGFASFHSSYMRTIKRFSIQYKVDPRKLIVALTEIDKVGASEILVEQLAKELQKSKGGLDEISFPFDGYFGDEQNVKKTSNLQ